MVSQNTLIGEYFANFINFVLFGESLSCKKFENRPFAKVNLAKFFLYLSFSFLYHKTPCFQENILKNFQKLHDLQKFILQNILHYSIRESLLKKLRLFPLVKVSLIKVTWKLERINSVKIDSLHVFDFVSKFLKKYIKLSWANI